MPSIRATCFAFAIFAAAMGNGGLASAGSPKVVASIKPIHSLVSGVMAGVAEPYLLIRGGGTPHSYSLNPSDAGALEAASLVFWVGPGLESSLLRPLESLARRAWVVSLAEAEGVSLLGYRDEADGEPAHGGKEEDENHAADEAGGHSFVADYDPHIWLAPANARAIVRTVAAELVQADPDNAERYRANARVLEDRLLQMEAEVKQLLEPVRDKPYLVFHDGFRYLQSAFGLNAVGAVILSPDRQPGARRVLEVRQMIDANDVGCIFTEPQFEPSIIKPIVEGKAVSVGVLDPLGAALEDGPSLYFKLMSENAKALAACLGEYR